MGCKNYMTWDRYPQQGTLLNKRVNVCFHYNTSSPCMFKGKIIREDIDAVSNFLTIILLDDGRVVTADECQYSIIRE